MDSCVTYLYCKYMSNMQLVPASSREAIKELKSQYIELISEGYVETVALKKLNFHKGVYLRLLLEDTDFCNDVNEARKLRADFWVSKIAETVDKDVAKDEVGSERLKFDKLQFLARADNPDRYGNNSKKLDINIDMGKFKLLTPEEAVKSLSQDPFAPIDVEFTEVEGDLL